MLLAVLWSNSWWCCIQFYDRIHDDAAYSSIIEFMMMLHIVLRSNLWWCCIQFYHRIHDDAAYSSIIEFMMMLHTVLLSNSWWCCIQFYDWIHDDVAHATWRRSSHLSQEQQQLLSALRATFYSGHFHATPCVSSYLCSPSHDFLASTQSTHCHFSPKS